MWRRVVDDGDKAFEVLDFQGNEALDWMERHGEHCVLIRFHRDTARQRLRDWILGLLPTSPAGVRGDGPNAPFVNDVAPLKGEDEDQSDPMNACLVILAWRR